MFKGAGLAGRAAVMNGVIMIIAWFKGFEELLAHFLVLRVSPTSTSFLLKASTATILHSFRLNMWASWKL